MNKRLDWIDVMRGIGIFLVVFAHIYQKDGNDINRIIYTFHMPLFFFLSGYVYQNIDEPLHEYFLRKCRSIVVPYFVWAVLSFVYWALLERRFRSEAAYISVAKAFAGIFYGDYEWLMFNVVLWFLPVLFGVEIAFAVLMRLKIHRYFKIGILIISTVPGILLADAGLPWGINKIFRYIIFYAAGYACRLLAKEQMSKRCIAISALVWGGANLTLYFHNMIQGIWFYVIGMTGILCTMMISILLRRVKVLALLGRNTMAILVMHGPFYRGLIGVIAILTHTSTEMIRDNLLMSVVLSIVVIVCLAVPTAFLNKYLPWTLGKKRKEKN